MDRQVTGYRCIFSDMVCKTPDMAEDVDRLYVGRVVSELLERKLISVEQLLHKLGVAEEEAVKLFKANCDRR